MADLNIIHSNKQITKALRWSAPLLFANPLENSVDSDLMASSEAIKSVSTQFSKEG